MSGFLRSLLCLGWLTLDIAPIFSQPVISTIPDQGVYPNATSRPIAFVIGDPATPTGSLTVTGTSSDAVLVPSTGLIFSGSGSNLTLTIRPAAGLTGPTVISVIVTATNGLRATGSFNFDVNYFTPVASAIPVMLEHGNAAWGDYDNDGFPDLLVSGYAGFDQPAAKLYHNNHNFSFTDANAGFSSLGGGQLSWVDFNADGFLDVLITDSTNRLYRNNGNGTFTPVTTSGIPLISYGAAAWGDFDNDGKLDVVTSGAESNGSITRILHNNGDGTFSDTQSYVAPLYSGSADWADYDNDGDLDLLLTGFWNTYLTKLYRNDNRVLTEVPAGLTNVYSSSARWGDYDNDGKLDILISGFSGESSVTRIYHNNGDGTFTDINAGLMGLSLSSAAWGDFDNDGFLDLIISGMTTNYTSFTGLYRNNHNGTFTLVPAGLTNVQRGSVCWADVDQDGDLDLFVAGYASSGSTAVFQLYRNNAPPNTRPGAPTSLVTTFATNGEVVLSWSVSTDAETPSGGLTYNLRVGTSSGGGDIVTPQAGATGLRRLPQFTGMHTNRWRLRDLPKGTYYWAVQAIDAGLAGSAFSAEQAFTITNTPPQITIAKEIHLGPSMPANMQFTVADAESAANLLTVTAQSLDATFIPAGSVIVQGAGGQRTLSFRVGAGQFGTNFVVVRVRDPGGLTTEVSVRVISELFTAIPLSASTNFYSLTAFPIGWGYPYAPPVVDLNHDGNLDVVLSGSIWSNNYIVPVFVVTSNSGGGNFTFNILSNVNFTARGYSSWLDDFDHDGNVDFISAGDTYADVQLAAGDGHGGFAAPRVIGPSLLTILADLDGDGKLDGLAFTSVDVRYYQNVGGLLRARPGPPLMTFSGYPEITSARAVDIDGDGDVDFFIPTDGTNLNQRLIMQVLRNSGRAQFTSEWTPVVGQASLYGTYTYDGDDDGDLDVQFLYETNYYGPILSGLAANDGSGHFYFSSTNLVPGPWGGDFNNDGQIDRFVTEVIGTDPFRARYRLYLKTSPGQYVPQSFVISDMGFFADLDGDGNLDILAQTQEVDDYGRVTSPMQWRFYRNNTDRTNAPPSVPTGLRITQRADDRITFAWNGSTDDHTPTNFISYNLRIGTNSHGVDVVPPNADPVTGRRWLAAAGNAGTLTFHDVRSLPPGTYYWSVQAIDGVFLPSAWAPEQTFTINRPSVSQLPDVVTPPALTSKPTGFTVTGGSSPVNALSITLLADDPSLIPNNGFAVSGTGAQRYLTITPANRSGDTDVTLTAADQAGFSAIVRFHVRVGWWDALSLYQFGIQRFEEWHWADMDQDGRLDFFGYTPIGTSQPQLFSFHNSGGSPPLFEAASNNLPSLPGYPIQVGGFDSDNVPDVFVLQQPDYNSFLLRVWKGYGTGFQFTPLTEVSNRSYVGFPQWLDFDNDGVPDILHFGWVNTNFPMGLLLARGKTDGTFEYYPQRIQIYAAYAIAAADFDLDGALDLIVSGADYAPNGRDQGTNFVRLYLNRGKGNFTPSSAGLPQGIYKFSIADFDGDGSPDVLLLPYSPNSSLPRLMRNVSGNFVEVATNLPPQLDLANWGDFDNDGDLDLLMTTSTDLSGVVGDETLYRAALFRNDGGGVFTRADTGLPLTHAHQATFADVDNDGDLDLLISGETGWNVTGRFLCLNTSIRSNTPPPAPSNLTVAWQSGGPGVPPSTNDFALLQWTPPQDAESGKSLTYNLRVGTTHGGSELISAVADPLSGQRRLTGSGNIGYSPRWRLSAPDGRYYWSVQAVDAGFAASPFAVEASFSYFHPAISTLSNIVIYPRTGAAGQSFTVGDVDSDASSLSISAFSSNPALLPVENITFGGAGSNRTVSLLPAPGAGGTTFVSVVVTDISGLSATNTFRLDVAYFTDLALNLPIAGNGTPSFADIDNDGDLDLYLSGIIYRNDGSLNFNAVAAVASGQRHGVAWGDFDRDGDLDLAVAGGGPTKIYRNDGNGTLTDTGIVLPDVSNAAIAWGDFDNDGDLDLVCSNGQLFRNDGSNGFTTIQTGIFAVGEAGIAWGDFDNDGRLDLLVSGFQGPSTFSSAIYRNNGDGTFSDIGAGLYGMRGSSVSWGDYDNDGYLDALLTGFNDYAYQVRVYHNNRNGTFTEVNLGLPGVAYGFAQWVDFDNDGWLDIFMCSLVSSYPNLEYATHIYRNQADGTFTDTQGGLPRSSLAAWGDLDRDSDLDLLLSGDGVAAAFVALENRCPLTNHPPASPANLVATLLPDNNVLLSWFPGTDLENTNRASLNYSLRAGTVPRGVNLISPPANSTNGYRRVVERGSVNSTSWLIRDVPRGTYYWSVQAIDSSFAGSAFSPDFTFTITNARPLISTVPYQLTVPGRPTPSLSFTVGDFETPASNLLVAAFSLNTNLVSAAGLLLAGSGSNHTITVNPLPNRSGTATIVLAVTDASGLVATSRFDVVVQPFTDAAVGLPPSTTGASAWGDYDNDGDLDIALAGSGVSTTSIYRNNSGIFSNQNFSLPLLSGDHLAWVDYDRDGDLDLTEAGWTSSGSIPRTYIFRNNGTNTFTPISLLSITNLANGSMNWADYDNDGDPDLFLTGDPNTSTVPDPGAYLYRNDAGVFTDSRIAFPQVSLGASAWGDFDNDGDLDFLLAGQAGSNAASAITKLFRNDGNGVFTEVATSLPGLSQCALAWGDYDNDGNWDILLAGIGTSSNLIARIYRNLGNGTFTDSGAVLTGVYQAAVAWGDYDNDGFLHALVCGTTNGSSFGAISKIYHNNGNGTFTELSASALPGVAGHSATWGDYDKDGDLDLLLGARVFRNNWNTSNTPPTAPTNLSALISSNNEVRLSWSPSTDRETTNSRGLNYNLRLGTTPGGSQIIAAQSDLITGYHRVPLPGNAGATTFWRVAGLTNGTYYWSVQAIDPAFAGSPFAVEATLVISRPIISAFSNRSSPPNAIIGPIQFSVSDAETPATNLIVTAISSDTNLVPAANLILSGNDTNRALTIVPATNRSGFVTITVLATDQNGETGSSSFQLTIERFADIGAGLPAVTGPLAWGDFDNDGFLDLILRDVLYHNNGNGTFSAATNLSAPIEGSANWGDYDADGYLDLLVTGSSAARILRNFGNNGFGDIAAGLAAPSSFGVSAWGDFDNDGDLDLILAGASGTRIYRNNGNQTFTDIFGGLPFIGTGSVAWGDYDKDGNLDLLLAGNNLLRIYRNNGNGTFSNLGVLFPGLYNPSVAWGDFNNDDWLDFVVIGSTNNASSGVVTRIYRNTTNSSPSLTFTNIYSLPGQGPAGVWKGAVACGDYDNDGRLDLLISGETTNGTPLTRLYHNDGGFFSDSGYSFPALRNSFPAWGDFDNDGNLDLLLCGINTNFSSASFILRNFGPPALSNTAPSAPGGLTVTVTGKSARMSWNAATDANQTNGLTYNLRVGVAPGLGNIVSPMSAANGVRRVPALGNVNHRLSWTLTNLTGGTYFWSVQAMDNSFAGSPFAVEQTFTITNRVPTAISRLLTTSEDTPRSITLTGSDPDNDPLSFSVASQPLFGILTGTPPVVTYTPASNYFGFDQFTFIANDRTTNSDLATIFITVTPVEDLSGPILGIQTAPANQVQLALIAEPWRTWLIEASEDLIHWLPITNLLATNLLMQLIDADAPRFPHRFYRAGLSIIQPVISNPMQTNGLFQFSVQGEPGRNYQLQVSTNLTTWTTLQNILLINSATFWSDPESSRLNTRFYRITSLQ